MKLQKSGVIGSIGMAILVVIIMVIVFFIFPRHGLREPSDWYNTSNVLNAMSVSPDSFFVLSLTSILSSIAFILIVIGIKERITNSEQNLIQVMTIAVSVTSALWFAAGAIGIIGWPWIVHVKDLSALGVMNAIYYSLVFCGDSAAGWVVLIIGWSGIKTKSLPKALSYFAIFKAIIMILEVTFQPFITSVIGMSLGIIFFPWLAITLSRSKN